jgi:hypothetical protein
MWPAHHWTCCLLTGVQLRRLMLYECRCGGVPPDVSDLIHSALSDGRSQTSSRTSTQMRTMTLMSTMTPMSIVGSLRGAQASPEPCNSNSKIACVCPGASSSQLYALQGLYSFECSAHTNPKQWCWAASSPRCPPGAHQRSVDNRQSSPSSEKSWGSMQYPAPIQDENEGCGIHRSRQPTTPTRKLNPTVCLLWVDKGLSCSALCSVQAAMPCSSRHFWQCDGVHCGVDSCRHLPQQQLAQAVTCISTH